MRMKRTIFIIIALSMLLLALTLASCGKDSGFKDTQDLTFSDPNIENLGVDAQGVKYVLDKSTKTATIGLGGSSGTGGFDSANGVLTIPAYIEGEKGVKYKVTDMAYGAFAYNSTIKELIINADIKELKGITSYGAFESCIKLEKVTINGNVQTIGERAFLGCTSLKSVSFGKVRMIGRNAFNSCTALEQAVISDYVTAIEKGAFEACTSLESVFIGRGLSSLNAQAFLNSPVKSLEVSAENTNFTMEDSVLYNSTKKTLLHCFSDKAELVIPEGVEKIASHAFLGNTVIKKVTFPSTLKEIGEYSFNKCEALKEIVFNDGLKSIQRSAFLGCASLQEIIFPSELELISNQAFQACTDLKKVTIGKNTAIDAFSYAFQDCHDDLVIYCYKGSPAHGYANTTEIKFELIAD